ncbi:hypothetical protein L3X38_040117 [Prunus dulcis]|nr:hypothetical protein L3X38_040117 [Prunus dulcis]
MATLHTKLLCLLPLLFIINGINAQLVHFPQFPVPFGNPFRVPDGLLGHHNWLRGHRLGAFWGDPEAAAVGGDPDAAAEAGLRNLA